MVVDASRSPSYLAIAAFTSVAMAAMILSLRKRQTGKKDKANDNDAQQQPAAMMTTVSAYEALIGNTPLIKLQRVSSLLGRSIFVKMESMNPGGTGKDRAALCMIRSAEANGDLPPPIHNEYAKQQPPQSSQLQGCRETKMDQNGRQTTPSSSSSTSSSSLSTLLDLIQRAMTKSRTSGLVVEGTSGSTGIALATLCAARGHACIVVMPDDQAMEKRQILITLGALVHVVPNAAISNPHHYVNVARRIAKLAREQYQIAAIFLDQFENVANFQVHYDMTGPELWQQSHENIDAFVMSSGTGGTLAGVGKYLKEQNPHCRIVLVDPPGSSLYHKIKHGVAYAPQQRERSLKRHRYDTLAEGIGLDRVTRNFQLGIPYIDDAISVTDQEAVDMAHWLLQTEGLWVGSSSAMNVVGAIRVVQDMPTDSCIVTMICDGGQRHVTRFWNQAFIDEWGLEWPGNNEKQQVPKLDQMDAQQETRVPDCIHQFLTSGRRDS